MRVAWARTRRWLAQASFVRRIQVACAALVLVAVAGGWAAAGSDPRAARDGGAFALPNGERPLGGRVAGVIGSGPDALASAGGGGRTAATRRNGTGRVSGAPGLAGSPTAAGGPSARGPEGRARGRSRAGRRGSGRRKGRTPRTPGDAGAVVVGIDAQDAARANAFFRGYDVDAGAADTGAQARAVTDWINARGGIGGHRVELRIRSFDYYTDRLSVVDRATCEDFGAGKPKAIATIDRHASTDILIPCLAERDVPTLVDAQAAPASRDFAKFPTHLFSPGSAATDRPQAAYVQGLKELGFFGKGGRVGVLISRGLPQFEPAAEALERALKDAGVEVTARASISLEDPVSFVATEADAMLTMRRANVDRIVAVDDNGVTLGQFMRVAEAQRYRPLYGVNSIASPQWLAQGAPAAQLRGAVGVGWSPLVDVGAADDPGGGPARGTCADIFRGSGVALGGRTPFGQFSAYQVCDSLLALRAAAKAGGGVTPRALRDGLERTGWRSALALDGRLSADRHDGASAWRALRFHPACTCFRYEGPERGF